MSEAETLVPSRADHCVDSSVVGGKQLHLDSAQIAHDPVRPQAGVAGLKIWGPLSYGGTPGTGPTPAAGSVMSRVFGCSWAGVSLSCLCRQSRSGNSDSFGHLPLSVMPSSMAEEDDGIMAAVVGLADDLAVCRKDLHGLN